VGKERMEGEALIIQTGNRTDIPAFYAEWFANRLREKYVLVRNPYNPVSVTRYDLTPDVVDLIVFCSKNPAPMRRHMHLLEPFHQYWFVTITPYGKEIEPNVPDKMSVMETFRELSGIVGRDHICWRYDPIIIGEQWGEDRHVEAFSRMCDELDGCTDTCVISFLDLYEKTKRNFPEGRAVPLSTQLSLTEKLVGIAAQHGMRLKPCGEDPVLETVGADCSGCMTIRTFEDAIGANLQLPPNPNNRKECACYLTGDIGSYNTCPHLCRYCYANADAGLVRANYSRHDPASPLLIGHLAQEDVIHQARQVSWIDPQMRLELII